MLFQNCKKNKKIIERNGPLTHWGRVTHICVGKLIIIGSDNGLSPGRRQAIIWTKAGIWLMGPLGTNFSEILIKIHTFLFKKMSSAKWRLFYLGLNVLSGVAMYLHCAAASLASSGTWDTGLGVFYALAAFLPSAHSGHSVLSCPAPSICPALITTLKPTIFDRSCSYLVQPLSLVGAWTQLIMRFLCSFSRI